MARTATRYPGIYARGSGYTFIYRNAHGKQRERSARTLDEARREKARLERQARDGIEDASNVLLHAFLDEWIDRYQGTGRRGFREETREEYRALLTKYAKAFFGPRTKLGQVSPSDVSKFVGWLVQQPNGRGGTLADKSVRNALIPLSAAMRTARREGLIPSDPTADAQLPHRPVVEDEDEDVRHLELHQLHALLAAAKRPDERLLLHFAAETGLRASEIIGLDVRHLSLDAERPVVRVRQRHRRGKIGATKSRYARRDVPLSPQLAGRLRAHVDGVSRDHPVFRSEVGGRVDIDNVRRRVIKPVAALAGVPFCGWHTLRHTCASLLFARGRNVVQVQRWLGHHSPSFTLDTYVHLLEGGVGDPLDLGAPALNAAGARAAVTAVGQRAETA